jgi:hypothetical protein
VAIICELRGGQRAVEALPLARLSNIRNKLLQTQTTSFDNWVQSYDLPPLVGRRLAACAVQRSVVLLADDCSGVNE